MNTPEIITELKPNEIFVFGSNLLGHGWGGAARLAHEKFGAEWGVGVGRTGNCYAIPTLQLPSTETGEAVKMSLDDIETHVQDFLDYAWENPSLIFYVTKIGCGIAGFKIEEIAPLFIDSGVSKNVILPKEFEDIINSYITTNNKSEQEKFVYVVEYDYGYEGSEVQAIYETEELAKMHPVTPYTRNIIYKLPVLTCVKS